MTWHDTDLTPEELRAIRAHEAQPAPARRTPPPIRAAHSPAYYRVRTVARVTVRLAGMAVAVAALSALAWALWALQG